MRKIFRDFTNTCHAILRSLFYEELGDIRPVVTALRFHAIFFNSKAHTGCGGPGVLLPIGVCIL